MLSEAELLFAFGDDIPIANCKLIGQSTRMWVLLKVAHERAHIRAFTFDVQQKIRAWHIQNQGFRGMNGVCSRLGFTDGKPGISTIGLTGKPLAPWNIEPISPNWLFTVERPAGFAALSFRVTMMSTSDVGRGPRPLNVLPAREPNASIEL